MEHLIPPPSLLSVQSVFSRLLLGFPRLLLSPDGSCSRHSPHLHKQKRICTFPFRNVLCIMATSSEGNASKKRKKEEKCTACGDTVSQSRVYVPELHTLIPTIALMCYLQCFVGLEQEAASDLACPSMQRLLGRLPQRHVRDRCVCLPQRVQTRCDVVAEIVTISGWLLKPDRREWQ